MALPRELLLRIKEHRDEIRQLREMGVTRRNVVRGARQLRRDGLWVNGDDEGNAELLAAVVAPDTPKPGFDPMSLIMLLEALMPLILQFIEAMQENCPDE